MNDLYDTDIVLWSEEQTARLKRVAAAERLNLDSPDWANIIEEIESVGRSEIGAVESLLFQAILHDLKVQAWPQSRYVEHWKGEARAFRTQASFRFVPSMRQRSTSQGSTARRYDRCRTRVTASYRFRFPRRARSRSIR